MRKAALPLVAALGMAMLLPQMPASAATITDQPLAEGTVQQVGPGLYFTGTNTFSISETDSAAGLIGRKHTVSEVDGIVRPQSAPATRADLGVYGDGWQAEFLGGQLNRKLAASSGAYTVTDLDVGEDIKYALTDTLSTPDGGSISKYTAADGSTLTESSRWDTGLGVMVTTVKEVVNADLTSAADGDDTFSAAAADLKPTYTWAQKAPGADSWRVTGVGTASTGTDTVTYDSKGRVSTVSTPAGDEEAAQTLKITYAASTTATSTSSGDYTGRVKAIDLTTGTTTQTVARYTYDSAGLLRDVTNPVESADPVASYTYDSTGRVTDIASPVNGSWDLDFSSSTDGSPNAEPVGPARPAGESLFNGATGITDPTTTQPPRRTSSPARSATPRPIRATATAPPTGSGTWRTAAPPGPPTTAGTSPTGSSCPPSTGSSASTTTTARPPRTSRPATTSAAPATCTTTATASSATPTRATSTTSTAPRSRTWTTPSTPPSPTTPAPPTGTRPSAAPSPGPTSRQ